MLWFTDTGAEMDMNSWKTTTQSRNLGRALVMGFHYLIPLKHWTYKYGAWCNRGRMSKCSMFILWFYILVIFQVMVAPRLWRTMAVKESQATIYALGFPGSLPVKLTKIMPNEKVLPNPLNCHIYNHGLLIHGLHPIKMSGESLRSMVGFTNSMFLSIW